MVTTGEQVSARDFLAGLPVLGESDLYDEISDRLGATDDGERACGDRARPRGAVPGPQGRQGDRRPGDRLWLRSQPSPCVPRTSADIPALRALGEAVVPPTYGPIDAAYAQRMLDEWWTPEVFAASLARNAHVVAELDGRVVAMANLGRLRASTGTSHVTGDREVMWKLYVHPDHQGHGIGRRLLGEIESLVEGDELWLEVVDGNEQAFGVLRGARLRGGRAGRGRAVARRRVDAQGAAMSRYRRYDGGDPLAPPVDLAEALDAIGEDVMAGYSPERAMREFLRRGGQDQRGLDDLARRVAERRRDSSSGTTSTAPCSRSASCSTGRCWPSASSWPATSMMDDGDRALPRDAARQPALLTGGRGRASWRLRLAQQRGARGVREDQGPPRPRAARPALRRHEAGAGGRDRRGPGRASTRCWATSTSCWRSTPRGEDTDAGLRTTSWPSTATSSPSSPQDIDELLDALAQRAAAAQRMLQLDDARAARRADALSQQAFGSPELDASSWPGWTPTCRRCAPVRTGAGPSGSRASRGSASATAPASFQDLAELDAARRPALPVVRRLAAGRPRPRRSWPASSATRRPSTPGRCSELEKALRDSGYLQRGSDGELRLSPKAMRQLGKALLRDVADPDGGRQGQREIRRAGAAGEPSGATRAWAFGDTEPWDVTRTITNALVRTSRRGRPGTCPCGCRSSDVEVQETEARTQAASRCWSTRRSRWRWTAAGCR